MATYTVKPGQNIWDIALLLHGGFDGMFDILVSNPSIGMNTEFVGGEIIEYHDFFVANKDVVAALKESSLTPSNGSRGVSVKNIKRRPTLLFKVESDTKFVVFQASGIGSVTIDWGDGSADETINLREHNQIIEHYFSDRNDGVRQIRFLGDFEFYNLDISHMESVVYATRVVTANKVVAKGSTQLDGFGLFGATKELILDDSVISDLTPIAKISLTHLSLVGCFFEKEDAFERYLDEVIKNYGERPPCTIIMSTDVSVGALRKINVILGEESWNTRESWKFIAGDKVYMNHNE